MRKREVFKLGLGLAAVWGLHEFLANCLVVVPNWGVSFGVGERGMILAAAVWLGLVTGRRFFGGWGWDLVLIGGGVNLADRLRWGYVRDYWNFWVFSNNINDWLIAIGLVVFILEYVANKNSL